MKRGLPWARICLIAAIELACAIRLLSQTPAPAESGAQPSAYLASTKENYLKLAAETDAMLRKDVLGVWFPRTVDHENGGFHSDFTRNWQPSASEGKFSVFQGRMTWVASQIVMRRPDLKEQFLPVTEHGVKFLTDVMWDKQYGGFFWGLDDKGQITPAFGDRKHLYGMSFCLYGLAAAYQATLDPQTLEMAKKSFRWIDEHAHDAKNGGYFEWLTRDGRVVAASPDAATARESQQGGFPLGYKSMNTHIHLLESFSQLYEVWKDDTLRQRLQELLTIVRDKICVAPGAMNLYFTPDWRATPDHDSFGHDIETAYLMLEAEEVLGSGPETKHDPGTERMAKMLVDHALAYGWDQAHGGFYDYGTSFGKAESLVKVWWVQMEGLNSLLLMHEKYGRSTDVYFRAFQREWQFVKDYQIDATYGGMYDTVGPDGAPTDYTKARMWKAAYHDGRGLLNVTQRLQTLAQAGR